MDVGNSDSASQPVTAFLTREVARSLALEAGFAEAGLVALPHAAEALDAARFAEWIEAGRAGTMGYLSRTNEDGQLVRSRVGIPFPWARSAVVCFASYGGGRAAFNRTSRKRFGMDCALCLDQPHDAAGVRRPSDYHKVLLKRLQALDARLHARVRRI